MEFDKDNPLTLTGTVTKMEFMNPHIYFYVDVKGKDGKVVNWAFEGGPPNVIYRQGWRKDTLKPGDVVTVKGFRAKDGTHLGGLLDRQASGRTRDVRRVGRRLPECVRLGAARTARSKVRTSQMWNRDRA